ncbi:hypothetical protein XENORESO_012238 [Xenotaenia resolanae]|uniref:Uncharacterized protein n=1 Tax=Xenotaenia resolanae TaxID=208358 RepID=A0ABV0VQM7_9TELE
MIFFLSGSVLRDSNWATLVQDILVYELDVHTWVCVSGCVEQQSIFFALTDAGSSLQEVCASAGSSYHREPLFPFFPMNRCILLMLLSLMFLIDEISGEFNETDPAPLSKAHGTRFCICHTQMT